MSLAQWREMAGTISQTNLALEPGASWAAQLGVLEFDGPDAAKFLQGYLTCDTEALPADQWRSTALCNLKGRVVANGWVATSPSGSLWLLVHQSLTDLCLEFLNKYLVFAKADGHNRSQKLVAMLGVGEPVPDKDSGHTLTLDQPSKHLDKHPDKHPNEHQLWLSVLDAEQVLAHWPTAEHLKPSSQLDTALISAHHALVNDSSTEQYLPQMLGLADRGAIDFDKGCYLGQEIVARAQHRGMVKRQLVQLQWEQAQLPIQNQELGELADASNASLGTVINWLQVTDATGAHRGIGLAVINAKGDSLPAQVQTLVTADAPSTGAIVFQVSKFEN